MKYSAQWRLTVIAWLVLAPVARGGVLSWPVTALTNWANPAGPDFQPYFLTNNGTRLEFLWPSGPLVVPLNELTANQYGGFLAMNPPTINPLFSAGVAGAMPGDGSGNSGGSGPVTTVIQQFLPQVVSPSPSFSHPPANPVPAATPRSNSQERPSNPGSDPITGSPGPLPLVIPSKVPPPASPQIASATVAVPEPGTAISVFAGILATWLAGRRRRQCDIA